MKNILFAILFMLPLAAGAAGGHGGELMKARVDAGDIASQQRGAKLFVNYCAGCHSLSYLRYSRVGEDLGLSEDLVKQYLILTDAKIGETMETAMDKEDGERWFGVAPPDLSLTARARGVDWIYTYLNSFYRDDSKPIGVNNLLFPDVAMPHVLSDLQGMPQPTYAEGSAHTVSGTTVPEGSGSMTPQQYQAATRDLTSFLAYAAEPIKAYRQALGIKVMLFLAVFFLVAYLLKREYWKDVHKDVR